MPSEVSRSSEADHGMKPIEALSFEKNYIPNPSEKASKKIAQAEKVKAAAELEKSVFKKLGAKVRETAKNNRN